MNRIKFISELILTVLFIQLFAFSSDAQINQSILFNPHSQAHASQRLPSLTGQGFGKFEVTLPAIHFHISNNSLTYREINRLINEPQTNESLAATLNSLEESNRLYSNFDFHIVGFHGRINDSSGEEVISYSASITDRAMFSIHFSKNLFQTIYEGNSQFADEWITLSPFRVDGLYYRDFALTFAKRISLAGEMSIKPSIRVRYLQGIGSLQTEKADLAIYTEPNGRYIDFDFDYRFNYAFPDRGGDYVTGNGHGFGLDLGVNFTPFKQLKLDLAISDIGFINFNRNNTNYSKDKDYRYEGLQVNFFEDDVFEWSSTDSLEALFDPEESNDPFSVNLQPSIKLLATYGLISGSKRNTEYFVHNIYFLYVQGFNKILDQTDIPIISFGYTFSLKNAFNIGPNITLGGNHDYAIGLQSSVQGGPFKFMLGSTDLSPIFLRDKGKGADVQASFALTF
ncbi:MAG: hypothetical protein HKN92_03230 [Chitinophagales bacterium]|nr:hypothetical protein [Chitinophagales bacterium]